MALKKIDPANLDPRSILLTGEAATILGLSPRRVMQLCDEGKITAQTTATGTRLFRAGDVLELAARRAAGR